MCGLLRVRRYITLFTCTPIGVNSHGILIRGECIEAPLPDVGLMQSDVRSGFPRWALIFASGPGPAALRLFGRGCRRSEVKAAHSIMDASCLRSGIDWLDDWTID